MAHRVACVSRAWKSFLAFRRVSAPGRRIAVRVQQPAEVLEARILLSAAELRMHDFNGDGFSDAAEMVNNGNWWVGISDGNDFNNSTSGLWTDWADASAWAHIDIADFNGDGRDDILGMDVSGNIWVGLANGTSFQFNTARWDEWAPATAFAHVIVGNFDGISGDDVATMDTSGNWWVGLSTGTEFVTQPAPWADWAGASAWSDIEVGDFDADGDDDVAGMDTSGNWWVGLSSNAASAFQTGVTPWADWAGAPAWADIVVGDFDRTGRDDVAGFDISGNWWVGRSNGIRFETAQWADWANASTWAEVLVGDFDAFGGEDVVGIDQNGDALVGTAGALLFHSSSDRWATFGDASGWAQFEVLRTADALANADDLAGFDDLGDWHVAHSNATDRFVFDPEIWADWFDAFNWATLDDDLTRRIELDRLEAT